ncbi:TIR domain-containing protein [Allostella humosa]|nr:TIR domain-containing protein [Stella humosa]
MQLASAGYEVWSDITRLIGGEVFWDDIEDAIRRHTAKFILVVSNAALRKEGVKDEINLAVMVERSDKVDRFVLPVRIEDVPFSDFKANIARKNAIDFTTGWAPALARVFEVLERDGVPKGAIQSADVASWCARRFEATQMPVAEPETVVSNWLPITAMPEEVSLFSIGVPQSAVKGLMAGTRLPWFPYHRLVGTFGNAVDLALGLPDQHIERHYLLTLDAMLAGTPPAMPAVRRADARRLVVNMLRQGWNNTMAAKGLLPFEMADNSVAWFFPRHLIEKDTAHFVDHTGKRRRKAMVGRSEKRSVYWHLGFIAKPVIGVQSHFVMKATIVFSEDGRTPLDSVEKMHRLRRGFCRNWWNDQWRDLLLAYATWIGGDAFQIVLPMGDFARVYVGSLPILFTSPITCPDPFVKTRTLATGDDDETPTDPPVEVGEDLLVGEPAELEND